MPRGVRPDEAAEVAAEAEAAVAAAEAAAEAAEAKAAADAAAAAAAEAEAAEISDDLLEAALTELAAVQDRFTRLQAEWDNYRKRTAEERNKERQIAAAHLIERLLPVLDDLERALEHTESSSVEALADGLQAVLAKLKDTLAYEGLEELDPQGQAFDMNLHQAVARVEDSSLPDETVTQVFQKGYKLKDRILRNAMVVVSTGGPLRSTNAEEPEADADADADVADDGS